MNIFKIDPEFENLIPPQSDEELKGLEQSLISDGFHEWEPLIVWKEEQILVDGHHRYKLCQKHNIPFKTFERSFEDRDTAILASLQIQLTRRNVSPYIRAALALKYKDRIAIRAKENQLRTAENRVCQKSDEQTIDTKKELAKIAGVSHDTIAKVTKIETTASSELKDAVKSGGISINEAATAIKVSEKLNGGLFTSESEEWYTPPEILAAVYNAFNNDLTTDPCSPVDSSPVKANIHYTKNDDGLKQPWKGTVFMNPPYGNVIVEWVKKAIKEYQEGNATELIILVPARTDTAWFNLLAAYPWCAVKGRLKFSNTKNSAPFPSAIFYIGENVKTFFENFCPFGPIFHQMPWECVDVS